MTDFRALCAELVDAIDSGIPTDRMHLSPLMLRVRAALAEKEPIEPSDQELNDTYWKAWHEHFDRTNSVLHAAGLRAVLARWGK